MVAVHGVLGGKEDEKYRPLANNRAKRVPAGEAVPGAVSDRVHHHRAQSADQRFEDQDQHERARPQ